MNKNDLQAIGFQTLSEQELQQVNGGSIFSRAWDAICEFMGGLLSSIS